MKINLQPQKDSYNTKCDITKHTQFCFCLFYLAMYDSSDRKHVAYLSEHQACRWDGPES